MTLEPSLLQGLSVPFVCFLIALLTRAIFAFLETSITALRLFRLKELASEMKGRYTSLFQTLEQHPHRVLITILVASNFADVTVASLATHIVERTFDHLEFSQGVGFSVGIGTATILLLVFGEILPKNYARGRGERTFKSMLWLINIVYRLLSPLAALLTRFSDFLTYHASDKRSYPSSEESIASEREVRFLINYIHKQGLMETEKTEMLRNIFDLGSTPVREIMVPATDMVTIKATTTIADALQLFGKCHFTRLPVYEEKADNIIGMAHQKDVLLMITKTEKKSLKDIMRPILFVPESMKVNQLLREFRQKNMHIAIVLNEHGIVTGLITLEDVLEEIVGDISDEHEPTTQKITSLQNNDLLADASITLEELEKVLPITFETEAAVTLGGFLTEQLQHMPKKGESLTYRNYSFQIQKATLKRVQQVLIFKNKTPESNDK